jgi:hypothetical protein
MVDLTLDRFQQFGALSRLVDTQRLIAADERLGIAARRRQLCEVVQGNILPVSEALFPLEEGTLAGLPQFGDDNDRHVGEGLPHETAEDSWLIGFCLNDIF